SRHADANAEDQRPVRHPLAKGLAAAPFGIHVVRKKVAGLSSVQDDIGLGDGAADGFTPGSDYVVFEELFVQHAGYFRRRSPDPAADARETLAEADILFRR